MTSTQAPPAKAPSLGELEAATPVIQFGAAKSMPYPRRLRLVVVCVALGFGLQVALLSAWAGLPFLLAAVVLTWVRGFDEKVDHRRPKMEATWEEAEAGSIAEVLEHDKRMRSWDASVMDISSARGVFVFLIALAALFVVFFVVRSRWPAVAWIVLVDGLLLFVPQWFNGMRFIDTRGDLVIKARHTQAVLDKLAPDALAGGELKARLHLVGREGERVPDNLKVVVRYPGGPEGFHGVQAQVVINRVQGTGYPYFYACLVAQEGLGLLARGKPDRLPENVIQEEQTEDGVEVIVLRQRTTRTSGYHTELPISVAILECALAAARTFAGVT